MPGELTFKASLDNLAKGVTSFCLILCVVIVALQINLLYTNPDFTGKFISTAIITLLIGVFVWCYYYAPVSYVVGKDYLGINRRSGMKKISYDEIQMVRMTEAKELAGTWRSFGVGGFFGYFGYYRSARMGNMQWYVTQRKNFVMIELKTGKKIIISPDEPSDFLMAVNWKEV